MLDTVTMLVMTAVTTMAGGLLLLACCRRADCTAMFAWALAMIVASAGLVVAAANGSHDPVVESVSTAMLLAASGLFWLATRLFRVARPSWWWVAGAAAWLLMAPLRSDASGWIALSCTIGAAYTCASVRELSLTRGERLPSWALAMVLIIAHAAVYGSRAALAAMDAVVPGSAPAPGLMAPALVLEAMVHINGMALILVALLLERHEKRASQAWAERAYVDGLTGIANRRRFDEAIDLLQVDRGSASMVMGLVLLDIDDFKSVNDSAGHEEGDRVLRIVAQVIAGGIRSSDDLAVRYGGEEFALLLKGADHDETFGVAERIRLAVAAAAIPHPGTGRIVTVSGGIDVLPAGVLRLRNVVIDRADGALYEAKRRGRNRIVSSLEMEVARLLYCPMAGAA